jgi:hypothetical protein
MFKIELGNAINGIKNRTVATAKVMVFFINFLLVNPLIFSYSRITYSNQPFIRERLEFLKRKIRGFYLFYLLLSIYFVLIYAIIIKIFGGL